MIPAKAAHAAALAAIHAAAYPPQEAWSAAAFASLLALPATSGLIDRRGGLILISTVAGEAEILTLAVHPAARRMGLGRHLLLAAIDHAVANGAVAMFLEVSDTNIPARNLYETSRFTPVGRRRFYYPDGSDALVMRRDITFAAAAER